MVWPHSKLSKTKQKLNVSSFAGLEQAMPQGPPFMAKPAADPFGASGLIPWCTLQYVPISTPKTLTKMSKKYGTSYKKTYFELQEE